MKRTIPFSPDMRQAILDDRKFCTTRTKRYGDIGDTFQVEYAGEVATCAISAVHHFTLADVAKYFYHEEGFKTPQEFKLKWNKLHPIVGFTPYQIVWTFMFHIVSRHQAAKEK